MATNVYEGLYILDSNRYGRESDAVSDRIRQVIENAGGEILVSRLWEERRLAYPIKGHRKGAYWLAYFRLGSQGLGQIRRACQLSEDVLRVLFLKVDPRIVDALVQHALAGPTAASAAGTEEGAEKADQEGKETVAASVDAGSPSEDAGQADQD